MSKAYRCYYTFSDDVDKTEFDSDQSIFYTIVDAESIEEAAVIFEESNSSIRELMFVVCRDDCWDITVGIRVIDEYVDAENISVTTDADYYTVTIRNSSRIDAQKVYTVMRDMPIPPKFSFRESLPKDERTFSFVFPRGM